MIWHWLTCLSPMSPHKILLLGEDRIISQAIVWPKYPRAIYSCAGHLRSDCGAVYVMSFFILQKYYDISHQIDFEYARILRSTIKLVGVASRNPDNSIAV